MTRFLCLLAGMDPEEIGSILASLQKLALNDKNQVSVTINVAKRQEAQGKEEGVSSEGEIPKGIAGGATEYERGCIAEGRHAGRPRWE